jgi:uncharacterized protein YjbI with pentapeptide repeats
MLQTLLSDSSFPYSNQKGGDTSKINKGKIKQLIFKEKPLNPSQIKAIIEAHYTFLENGGAGGKWKIIDLKGIVLALYFGQEVTMGKQAAFDYKRFSDQVNFKQVLLPFSNFCASHIEGIDFQNADLSYSVFTDVCGKAANFSNAVSIGTDFTRANLKNANFQNANLFGADFENCDLSGADFRGAILTDARFPGAILKNVKI